MTYNKSTVGVVTGSSSGIGKCVAKSMAENGSTVVMMSRNKERGKNAYE